IAVGRGRADGCDLRFRLPLAARRVHRRRTGWRGRLYDHRRARAHEPVGRHRGHRRLASARSGRGAGHRLCARDRDRDRLLRGDAVGDLPLRARRRPLADGVSAHRQLATDLDLAGRGLRLRRPRTHPLSVAACGPAPGRAPIAPATSAGLAHTDAARAAAGVEPHSFRGAPPNPISLPSSSRYVALRTPFEYLSRSAGSSPREPISEMTASRSSTNTVISAPPARPGSSLMYSERSSARFQTTSVEFGKNEGSPRSRPYHARAAVKSRTRIPANSATPIGIP